MNLPQSLQNCQSSLIANCLRSFQAVELALSDKGYAGTSRMYISYTLQCPLWPDITFLQNFIIYVHLYVYVLNIQYTQRWTKILINFNYIDYHNSQECGQGREGMVYIYLKRRCYFLIPSIPILNKWILSDMCRMRFFFENRYSLH